jgi:predicted kinase
MIIMVGIPGSGKSFFAEKFADTFRAPYINRGRIAQLTGNDTKITDEVLHYQLDELLKTQQSIILEGGANSRTERSELSRKTRAAGYETLFIWVQTDPATAKARALKEDAALTSDEYDNRVKRFAPLTITEKPVVISGKHTYATQAKVVLKKLSSPRAEISTHDIAPIRPEQPGRRNITVR